MPRIHYLKLLQQAMVQRKRFLVFKVGELPSPTDKQIKRQTVSNTCTRQHMTLLSPHEECAAATIKDPTRRLLICTNEHMHLRRSVHVMCTCVPESPYTCMCMHICMHVHACVYTSHTQCMYTCATVCVRRLLYVGTNTITHNEQHITTTMSYDGLNLHYGHIIADTQACTTIKYEHTNKLNAAT